MATDLLLGVVAFSGVTLALGLYVVARPHGHPVEVTGALVSRRAAERRAADIAESLLGQQVDGWLVYSALVRDEDALDAIAATGRPGPDLDAFMERWGLSGEWRVQFIRPGPTGTDTVLVGLNGRNELALLDADLRPELMRQPTPAGRLNHPAGAVDQLKPFGAHWGEVRAIGSGTVVDHSSDLQEVIVHVRDEAGAVTLEATITSVDGHIRQIDRTVHVDERAASEHRRRQARQDLAGTGAVLTSVVGLVVGLLVLVTSDVSPHLGLAVGLGALTMMLNLAGDVLALRSSIVGAYDRQVPLWLFRLISGGTMLTMSLLYGIVVLIATGAGTALADDIGLAPFEHADRQLVVGVCVGAGWLAFSACFYALAERAGLCRLSRHPNGEFVRRSGHPWAHSSLAVGVSALSEETVFRLLGVSIVLAATDSTLVAAVASAIVWAFVHSGQVTDPPIYRLVELAMAGTALAFVFLEVGLVAVLTAHAVFNTVILRSHSRVVRGVPR